MKNPSVMQHLFSKVPKADMPRSQFDRTHGHKTTFDAGDLVPFYLDEVLPGDTFNLKANAFARMATPIHPLMDNAFMETFFFFVPYRLIWDNWQKQMGERNNPTDSIDYNTPQIQPPTGGYTVGSLFDYFGLPINVENMTNSAMPSRAYNLIYNEWFRDQNLQDSITVDKGDGPDNPANYVIKKRNKRHDYFTSSLPNPQKGDAVDLPLGTIAPVVTNGLNPQMNTAEGNGLDLRALNTSNTLFASGTPLVSDQNITWGTETGLQADLSTATAATINQLRQAFQVQKLLERDARGGTRYTEIVKAHFGVTSPDARLQRPEYLGGGSTPININPVTQTSSTDGTSPQGNLAAFGTAGFSGHGFSKSFTEHGLVIGLVNVRADLTYQQRIDRMWSRTTRLDHYWPELSHIGEQAVISKEIYADGTASDEDVFGYQERYAEYRYKPSQITGQFRSAAATSLDVWHLSQEFSTRPTLSDSFIEENPPFDRVIAVNTEPHFIFDSYISLKCARVMPLYGVPGLIDHF